MFEVKREKNNVRIDVSLKIPGADTWYWTFHLSQHTDAEAQLLVNAINNNLEKVLKEIRKEAYEMGFKDARAKRRKETWFSGRF
jgi:hypothetical protein